MDKSPRKDIVTNNLTLHTEAFGIPSNPACHYKAITHAWKHKNPTLVIHGDKDFLVPPQLGQAVADAIPKSKMVIIKGMGHTFFNRALEEKIAHLVVEHIKKHSK